MRLSIGLSETDILKSLCAFFEEKGFSCKQNVVINEEGRLFGFDAICKSRNENIVLEVKRLRIIDNGLIQDIITEQRLVELKGYKFYLCVPFSSGLSTGTKELMKLSGIGLIRVRKRQIRVVLEARTSEDKMRQIITYMRRKPDSAAPSNVTMRKFETIVALGAKPFKFRIARELLEKIERLENVTYSDLLRDFKKKYEAVENSNDEHRVVLDTLEKLWSGKYGKPTGAKAFDNFDKFEPILKEIPRYRDHIIHPFQVFLMGTVIIDSNYSLFSRLHKRKFQNSQDDSVDFSWLLCSTFHDMCYPIQMYETFNKNFFQNFLQTEMSPVVFQTEKLLLEDDNLKYLDQLVSLYGHYKQEKNTWTFDSMCQINNKLRADMISEISRKSHALLSAMALIKKILTEDQTKTNANYMTGRFSTDVYPAALAISLHDEKMLDKIEDCVLFEKMPLSFLLIYCDLVQECGRSEGEESVELSNFDCGSCTVESTLKFVKDQEFKYKVTEMEKIYGKISSESTHFKLNLKFGGSGRSEDSFKN